MTGEKLERPDEFLQFLVNDAIHVIHPDIAFVGGITGMRKIADLAELFYVPVVTHNVGSLQLLATAHFGASCRNFVMTENRIPQGGLFAEMNAEPMIVKDGKLRVPDTPGLWASPWSTRCYEKICGRVKCIGREGSGVDKEVSC